MSLAGLQFVHMPIPRMSWFPSGGTGTTRLVSGSVPFGGSYLYGVDVSTLSIVANYSLDIPSGSFFYGSAPSVPASDVVYLAGFTGYGGHAIFGNLNLDTGVFTTVAILENGPSSLSFFFTTVYAGSDYYALGGFQSLTSSAELGLIYSWDPVTSTWTNLSGVLASSWTVQAAAVVINGNIVFGTTSNDLLYGGLYSYDPTTDTLTNFTALAGGTSTSYIGVGAVGNTFYVAGAYSGVSPTVARFLGLDVTTGTVAVDRLFTAPV